MPTLTSLPFLFLSRRSGGGGRPGRDDLHHMFARLAGVRRILHDCGRRVVALLRHGAFRALHRPGSVRVAARRDAQRRLPDVRGVQLAQLRQACRLPCHVDPSLLVVVACVVVIVVFIAGRFLGGRCSHGPSREVCDQAE